MQRTANTGGMLNILNGKMGISAPSNSVPIIKLIDIHNPKSYDELEKLIEYHYLNDCKCGIKSKGTVYDFGEKLYEAQMEYWGEYIFTLDECKKWMYNLFIINSLKGSQMEKKAIDEFNNKLPTKYIAKNAIGIIDEEYRIDIEIKEGENTILGIQVKPLSYQFMREEIKDFNKKRNNKYGIDVKYLYYNENQEFINLDNIIEELNS